MDEGVGGGEVFGYLIDILGISTGGGLPGLNARLRRLKQSQHVVILISSRRIGGCAGEHLPQAGVAEMGAGMAEQIPVCRGSLIRLDERFGSLQIRCWSLLFGGRVFGRPSRLSRAFHIHLAILVWRVRWLPGSRIITPASFQAGRCVTDCQLA
jgi:hypothetical protein